MKTGITTILLLLFTATANAAPTPPEPGLRVTPASARQGSTVTLEALVYNSTERTVTVDVLFSTPAEEIETVELTIPALAAKTAASEWTVPEEETTVTASVIRATDANRRTVPELLGIIGTASVGAPQAFAVGNLAVGAKTWFGNILQVVEPWRVERAAHYAALRDRMRAELGIDSVADIGRAEPRQAEAPATGEPDEAGDRLPAEPFPIEQYGTLLLASALAAIFASAALFYIAAILIILFVLRQLARLFSR